MKWVVPKIWKGGDVWILGGGPSIITEFEIPLEVVEQVFTGTSHISIYSEYLKPIYNKHIIGINVAYMMANWFDMIFVGDSAFFTKHKAGLYHYPNLVVSCAENTSDLHWVKHLPRHAKLNGISPSPKFVCWNKNSGSAAISIAVQAGAKRIFLLGFDMTNQNKVSHWHNHYERAVINGEMKPPPYKKHLIGFAAIKQDAKEMGVEIINVSPKSAITEFPKITLKEALQL